MEGRCTVALKSFSVRSLVAAGALTLALIGCSKGQSAEGKYFNEKRPQEFTELKKDGVVVIQQGSATITGKYTVEGNVLTLTVGNEMAKGKIEGNTITDNQGEHWLKN